MKRSRRHNGETYRISISPYDFYQNSTYVYVDQPPTLKTVAERMADKPRSKLLPKAPDPFQTNHTTSHKNTLDEDGIPNLISINRATPAPRLIIASLVRDSTPIAQRDTSTPGATRGKMHHATKTHSLPGSRRIAPSYISAITLFATLTQGWHSLHNSFVQIYQSWKNGWTVEQQKRTLHQTLLVTHEPSTSHKA